MSEEGQGADPFQMDVFLTAEEWQLVKAQAESLGMTVERFVSMSAKLYLGLEGHKIIQYFNQLEAILLADQVHIQ